MSKEKLWTLYCLLMFFSPGVWLGGGPEWARTGFGSVVYVVFFMFVAPLIVIKVLGWFFGVDPFSLMFNESKQLSPRARELLNNMASRKVYYPPNWDELSRQAQARDDHECGNCHATRNLHVHHVVPLSKGGTNNLSNLRTLCEDCHKRLHPHMR